MVYEELGHDGLVGGRRTPGQGRVHRVQVVVGPAQVDAGLDGEGAAGGVEGGDGLVVLVLVVVVVFVGVFGAVQLYGGVVV